MCHSSIPLWGVLLSTVAFVSAASGVEDVYDVILRRGLICDGLGGEPVQGDLAISGDTIKKIGDLAGAKAGLEIDADGMVVAPGFINMLSWATDALLIDGRSQSELRQGVTLEVFGEGWSMGPLNPWMKADLKKSQGDLKFDVAWTTLAEYLEHLEKRGVSCNVASFVGATTVRIHELGYADRKPTPQELSRMCELVRREMKAGAMGVGSSLIYAPAFYAGTDELIELCKAAAEYDGLYVSHLRSEGNQLLESVDEFLRIAREAGIRAEIYHLKAAGESNWPKLDKVIAKVEEARSQGLGITADIYTYTAGGTGLNATMPPWVQEGGLEQWVARLRDPRTRARVVKEMKTPTNEWENLLLAAGSPERVLLVGFKSQRLKPLAGKTLAAVAAERGRSPEETAIDLVIEDGTRVDAIYFFMSEEEVRKKVALPWVSFCSDAESLAPEGPFLKLHPHPRAYGTFARLLGKYVREEQATPLPEAIRRLTSFPADNLRLKNRGRLAAGFLADVVVFDPATIIDHATYEKPQQYATGVKHVFVNGRQVLRDGEHTGATPGRFVRGPGFRAN
ncbi:MAG TPA: D-aminoacylase [Pirellulales bacterium]|nr:D-aminoacylase [Pirellulales bacterium]